MVLGGDKAPRAQNQFRATGFVICEVHLHQAFDHLALPLPDSRHTDAAIVLTDAEFMASKKIRGHLRAVNHVLAGKTGYVWTGAADILAFHDGTLHSLRGECPGKELAGFPTSQDEQIIILRRGCLCLVGFVWLWCGFGLSYLHFESPL
jgi:hypothetical protein